MGAMSGSGIGTVAPPTLYEFVGVRSMVHNEYSNITLHIMAKFSRDEGINLQPMLEIKNPVSTLFSEKNHLMSYATKGGSSVEDWKNSSEPWLLELRKKHLHISAHLATSAGGLVSAYAPNTVNGKRVRVVHPG